MPLPMAPPSPQIDNTLSTYPAITKQTAGFVDGIPTDVASTQFSDKIMITISQEGRLAQWIHVSLEPSNPNFSEQYLPSSADENSLLPLPHLTPKTLLGGSTSERENLGQLYASQIASAIVTRNPEEKRTVLIGLGLSNGGASREKFYDTVDLVLECL